MKKTKSGSYVKTAQEDQTGLVKRGYNIPDDAIVPNWYERDTVEQSFEVKLSDEQWMALRAEAEKVLGDSLGQEMHDIISEWLSENIPEYAERFGSENGSYVKTGEEAVGVSGQLEQDLGLVGKTVRLVAGDYRGQVGEVIEETGYNEVHGVVVQIRLEDGTLVEYDHSFWEEI